ncbi:hypothetical protein ACFXMT_14115 [Streptomyces mirabilis]|uniref:hypothetical protein n=1 Tax=Streptomyces mirabilis TaxID=68239 RepID=UPI0036BB9580
MIHTENIKRVIGVTTEEDECGFFVLCVEVITSGNVRKVVRYPHLQADALRANLVSEFESMDPADRKTSWDANIRSIRKGSK